MTGLQVRVGMAAITSINSLMDAASCTHAHLASCIPTLKPYLPSLVLCNYEVNLAISSHTVPFAFGAGYRLLSTARVSSRELGGLVLLKQSRGAAKVGSGLS